jgi:hypothetical protein
MQEVSSPGSPVSTSTSVNGFLALLRSALLCLLCLGLADCRKPPLQRKISKGFCFSHPHSTTFDLSRKVIRID